MKILFPILLLFLLWGACGISSLTMREPITHWGDRIIEEEYRIDPLEATTFAINERNGGGARSLIIAAVIIFFTFLIGALLAAIKWLPDVLKQVNKLKTPPKIQAPQQEFWQAPMIEEPQQQQHLLGDGTQDDTQWLTVQQPQ